MWLKHPKHKISKLEFFLLLLLLRKKNKTKKRVYLVMNSLKEFRMKWAYNNKMSNSISHVHAFHNSQSEDCNVVSSEWAYKRKILHKPSRRNNFSHFFFLSTSSLSCFFLQLVLVSMLLISELNAQPLESEKQPNRHLFHYNHFLLMLRFIFVFQLWLSPFAIMFIIAGYAGTLTHSPHQRTYPMMCKGIISFLFSRCCCCFYLVGAVFLSVS